MNHVLLATLTALLLTACPPVGPNGRDVGAACETDRDCTDECEESDAFGDGMCTMDCDDDNDCPDGTVCLLGGLCAVECDNDRDCEAFSQGFECRDTLDRGLDRVEVCLDD